jgi:hypothetical protein
MAIARNDVEVVAVVIKTDAVHDWSKIVVCCREQRAFQRSLNNSTIEVPEYIIISNVLAARVFVGIFQRDFCLA